jgi:hypothetical protein
MKQKANSGLIRNEAKQGPTHLKIVKVLFTTYKNDLKGLTFAQSNSITSDYIPHEAFGSASGGNNAQGKSPWGGEAKYAGGSHCGSRGECQAKG